MRVEACSIGPIARLHLQQPGSATVIAAFDRSFYLDIGSDIICIAADSLYDGPLNLLIRTDESFPSWCYLDIAVGQRWALHPDALRCFDENGPVIDVGRALPWQPKPIPRDAPSRRQVVAGINSLRKRVQPRLPDDGLSRLALHPDALPADGIERAALLPLQALRRHQWSDDNDQNLAASLHDLLGLGPGLTPSGDDLIAGMLIACHYVGWGETALGLWRRLESAALRRTTRISLGHLAAAAEGLGAAPLHDLLDVVIENRINNMTETLDATSKIGHCSGWDAIGGLLLLLDAWTSASASQPVAA